LQWRVNRTEANSDMSKRLVADDYIATNSSKSLIREVGESQPYLTDEGWHQAAKLMLAAADEIEQLHARIDGLKAATQKH
jgi:hypothetical protein